VEGIGPVVVANSSGSDRRGVGAPLVRRLRSRSQAESMAASERLKIEAASLTAGTVGSGAAVLRLYVCNVDRVAVDVVDVYVYRPGTAGLRPLRSPQSGELAQCTCRPGAGSTRDTTMIKPVTLKGTGLVAAVTAS